MAYTVTVTLSDEHVETINSYIASLPTVGGAAQFADAAAFLTNLFKQNLSSIRSANAAVKAADAAVAAMQAAISVAVATASTSTTEAAA